MFKKQIVSRVIALAIVGCTMLNISIGGVYASEMNVIDNESEMAINIDDNTVTPYLGGGPSPNAAWSKKSTKVRTFTSAQLKTASNKLYNAVQAGKKSTTAFNAANFMVGMCGWPGVAMSAYLTFCTSTKPSVIQDSYNAVSYSCINNKRSLKVEEWKRDATGERMCVFYRN